MTILVDPGHGGTSDEGAMNVLNNYQGQKTHIVYEKDLALDLSQEVLKMLEKRGYKALLTRSMDRELGLPRRAEMADKIQADLFISIHLNANPNKSFHGFEIYYLSTKSNDETIRKIEEVENKAFTGEELLIHQTLMDLTIAKTSATSRTLALNIERSLRKKVLPRYGITNRGIRGGNFYVLALSKRPAVLIEVGFLSNDRELKTLLKKKFQKDFASSLADAIDHYFIEEGKIKKDFLL